VLLNVILAVFNFLPIPPLDGFRVAVGLLPDELSRQLARIEPWGMGILLLLVFAPFITGGQFSPLFDVMGPVINFIVNAFVGAPGGLRVA
jgi:Zn-dependent protease